MVVNWLIEGIPFGCVYALIAVGIVLTYKTTGVFNFAFAAQAFVGGAVYVQMVEVDGDPRWLGLVVSVLIVSPLLGLVLDRVLFRAMRTSGWQVKLVSVLGLFIALPMIAQDIVTGQAPVPTTVRSSIPPMFGINSVGFNIGSHFVAWDFTMAAILTVVVVLVLGFIFRYTATGLQMRAVVESPRMVELAGVDSERVSALAWMLSSTLAGLAGVILATLAQTLDVNTYTLLVIVCIAAAAVGRLQSIPITFAAGVLLGVGQRALPDVLQHGFGISSSSTIAIDLIPTLPFIVLFLVIVLVRSIRERRETADPLAGVDPPPPAIAATYKTPELERTTKIVFPIFLAGFLVVMLTLVSGLWVFRITDGFTLAVTFLSITIITGFAGQISLAQATFAGIGGFTAADLAVDHGVPILLGLVIGAAVAALVGALFALPALRLGGIYLTLATLAFGLMVENVVFNRPEISNGQQGVVVPRPSFANTDRSFFILTFIIFAIVAFAVILIRNGTTGRFLTVVRGSENAAASIGINATALRITSFALSAGVAGIGGALIGMVGRLVQVGQEPTFPTILGIAWVVFVVTLGSRTVDGAVNAGLSFVLFQWLLEDGLHLTPGLFLILFGLGAITYARHPEGIVEYQTRKSVLDMARARALAARAKEFAKRGELPESYTRVREGRRPVRVGPRPLPRLPARPDRDAAERPFRRDAAVLAARRSLDGRAQRDAAPVHLAERRVLAGLDAALRRGAPTPRRRLARRGPVCCRGGARSRDRRAAPIDPGPPREPARLRPARRPRRRGDRHVRLAAVPGRPGGEGEGLAGVPPHLERRPHPRHLRARRRVPVLAPRDVDPAGRLAGCDPRDRVHGGVAPGRRRRAGRHQRARDRQRGRGATYEGAGAERGARGGRHRRRRGAGG